MNKLLRKVYIHPLMWVMIAFSVLTGYFIDLLLVFFIIVMHELGHASMALSFRWRIKRIVFLPFGGVAEVDEHGNRPAKEELFVILAGPLQHLWLFIAAWLLFTAGWMSDNLYQHFWQFNLAILLFNLLPVYPLDGGKLLLLFVSLRRPFLLTIRLAMIFSAICLVLLQLLILLFLPFHFQAWLIIAYLTVALWREWKDKHYTFIRFLLERYYGKKDVTVNLKPLQLSADTKIASALEQFRRNTKHIVYVTEQGKEIGRLDENEVLYAYFSEKRTGACLKELLPLH
ncbi:M50 family metallopeptidase [Bacillus sp. FJAT-42315]|uniref:M50 family metallopeptidase n=1 Tax=Bacillus sp. FJAT-42315 TaxID=2014077 RepID=UPI000C247001|nr:M50 family metallopeptidase [Bacillus sp. FJAT-42315]